MTAPIFSSISLSLPVVFSDFASGFIDFLKRRYDIDDINVVVLAGPANAGPLRYWLLAFYGIVDGQQRLLEIRVAIGKLRETGELEVRRLMPAKPELVGRLFGPAALEMLLMFLQARRRQRQQ